jgi:hypothetical protein
MAEGWRLDHWLRRVGFREIGTPQPELLRAVQPVVVVGDHSTLTPAMRGAEGIWGCALNSAAAIACWEVVARSPGGMYVMSFGAVNEGAAVSSMWRWRVGAPTYTALTAVLPNPVDPARPVLATGSRGYGTTLAENQIYCGGNGVTGAHHFRGPLWVPSGQALSASSYLTLMSAHVFVHFIELDVAPLL